MFKVYIIYSAFLDRYYVGSTANIEDRLFRHKNSGSKSTKSASDWALVYSEEFDTRSEAQLCVSGKSKAKRVGNTSNR
jgi:putative endonuclease